MVVQIIAVSSVVLETTINIVDVKNLWVIILWLVYRKPSLHLPCI